MFFEGGQARIGVVVFEVTAGVVQDLDSRFDDAGANAVAGDHGNFCFGHERVPLPGSRGGWGCFISFTQQTNQIPLHFTQFPQRGG